MKGNQSWGSIKRNKALNKIDIWEFIGSLLVAIGIFAFAIFF